jgi:hypothetical protein
MPKTWHSLEAFNLHVHILFCLITFIIFNGGKNYLSTTDISIFPLFSLFEGQFFPHFLLNHLYVLLYFYMADIMLYSRKYTIFWKWDLLLSSGKTVGSTYSTVPKLNRQRMRSDPVSEMLCHFFNMRQYRKFRNQITLSVMHYNYNLLEVTLNVRSFFWGKIYDILVCTVQ